MPLAKLIPQKTYSSGDGRNFVDFRLQGMRGNATYELTDALISLRWSESLDQVGISGTVELMDPGKDLLGLARGERVRLLFREPVGKVDGTYKELHRWVLWDRHRTSAAQNQINFGFFDLMVYLNTTEDFFLFQKDKRHKKGWTATEITQWAAQKYKFPLGPIVKSKIEIPYIKLEKSSVYDLLAKVWNYDRQRSRRRYILRAVHDKLYVFPKVDQPVMWEYSEDTNLIDSEFISSLEGMYTAVTIYGTAETNQSGVPDVKVTVQHKKKVDEFGYLHKVIELDGVTKKSTILKIARNALLTTLRENLDATVSGFGIPYLRAGDPIAVRDHQSGIVGAFFIGDVTHTISSSGFITNLNLNWMDVVPSLAFSSDELHPASSGFSGGTGAATVLAAARTQLGVPYAWGGGNASGPTRGIGHGDTGTVGLDCSGLAVYAFSQVGVSLPHHTDAIYAKGNKVPVGQEQAGDCVFYTTSDGTGSHFGHMAIWVGNGTVIQATRPVVKEGPRSGHAAVCRFAELARIGGGAPGAAGEGAWPGDAAPMSTRARWLASRALSGGIPAVMPIMAALPESGLKMQPPGSNDGGLAVGLFQIHPDRASGDGFNADDRDDAEMQIAWFIKNVNKFAGQYKSQGESGYGAWIQRIEGGTAGASGYQSKLAQAKALIS